MVRPLLVPLALLGLAACQQSAPSKLAVRDAWVRLAAVPGSPAAAYFTVVGGAKPDRLVEVTSPRAGMTALHRGETKGGVATMAPLDGIDVPAGGAVTLKPGGAHAMLFDVFSTVTPGKTLPLSFRFQSGKTVKTEAKVLAAGDAAPT